MNELNQLQAALNNLIFSGPVIAAIILISVWSLIWKGIALWKSARLGHKNWFIALLLINTMGILEIVYIFLIAKKEETAKKMFGETPSQV